MAILILVQRLLHNVGRILAHEVAAASLVLAGHRRGVLRRTGHNRRQVVGTEVRLELLEDSEDDSNLVFLLKLFERRGLDPFEVQALVPAGIFGRVSKNVRCGVEQVVEELGHQKGGALVLLTAHRHLALEVDVLRLQKLGLVLRLRELLFDFLQLLLKELDEVVVRLRAISRCKRFLLLVATLAGEAGHSWLRTVIHRGDVLLRLEILHLLFVALDDLLEVVRPLGQLLLDIHVDLNVLLQLIDFRFVVVVLSEQRLGLLGLKLELLRQLAILHDR